MKVTTQIISLILNRLRHPTLPKLRQSDIAIQMGYGKAWVSKLLNGKIQNLTEEQTEKLEKILDIRFTVVTETGEKFPEAAKVIGRLMSANPVFNKAMLAMIDLGHESCFTPRFIETQDMTKVGQEIIRIAFANEHQPGKVASLVLSLLR